MFALLALALRAPRGFLEIAEALQLEFRASDHTVAGVLDGHEIRIGAPELGGEDKSRISVKAGGAPHGMSINRPSRTESAPPFRTGDPSFDAACKLRGSSLHFSFFDAATRESVLAANVDGFELVDGYVRYALPKNSSVEKFVERVGAAARIAALLSRRARLSPEKRMADLRADPLEGPRNLARVHDLAGAAPGAAGDVDGFLATMLAAADTSQERRLVIEAIVRHGGTSLVAALRAAAERDPRVEDVASAAVATLQARSTGGAGALSISNTDNAGALSETPGAGALSPPKKS